MSGSSLIHGGKQQAKLSSYISNNVKSINQGENLKHNSYSESCFSLDDYNANNHNNNHPHHNQQVGYGSTSTGADSPALEDLGAPSFGQQQHFATARPKLWSMYNAHQQQQQQQHLTMRPTRTFVGQPQLKCFYNQAPPASQLNPGDLILTMATSQQLVPPPVWSAAVGAQQQQHQNLPSPVLAPPSQQQPPPQQQVVASDLLSNQCAFHQQQQQLQLFAHQQQANIQQLESGQQVLLGGVNSQQRPI